MGAYLSEPITVKESTDEVGERVLCGASSMQGWRVTQEDAHNCTLEFDEGTSFFAVYDGHGGHEVATYTAQHLPQYLKNCEAYKRGDYTQALKDAFLGFDATLTTPEVLALLKQIANHKDGGQNSGSDEEEENVKNLYEEAEMPIEQVMAKYQNDFLKPNIKKIKQDAGKPPVSPFLRGRRSCSSGASTSGSGSCSKSSTSMRPESKSGNTESGPDSEDKRERDTEVSSSSSNRGQSNNSSSSASRQHSGNNEADQASDSSASNGETKSISEPSKEIETAKHKAAMPDSSEDVKVQSPDKASDHSGEGNPSVKVNDASGVTQEVNGEIGDADEKDLGQTTKDSDGVTSSSAPHENGEVVKSENKRKSPTKVTKERKKRVSPRRHTAMELYRTLLGGQDQSDSDSDDEGDESFQGVDNSSDEDADDDEEEDDDDDDDDDDDNEEEEEEEEGVEDRDNENEDVDDEEDEDEEDDSMLDDEDEDDFTMKMIEEPGSDSGCTAVVALLKDQELYVANAGDSRCVVCRRGQAIEMSLDHKPEDETEMERIVMAGGKVTADGRVNGGLNLSRALGDHAYKQSEGLSAQEQMITALPDVRTLMIDPTEDEFMVLACDGIWNFMSSQEVVDFVRPRILDGQTKLSQICEELFDHCLAPNTLGDGTGCDNMTAVIVQFRPDLMNQNERKSLKRSASPVMETSIDTTKRPKTEEASTCV